MNIFKSLCKLFLTKHNWITQLSIFAIAGLGAISFVNTVSLFFPNSFYNIFAPVKNDTTGAVFAILGLMIFIFFTGYKYKFTSQILKDGSIDLPSISLDCFVIFSKVFPLFLVWAIYLFLLCFAGDLLFGYPSIEGLFIVLLTLVFLPFIHLIFVVYSENFTYKKEFFNPVFMFKLIKTTYAQIILLIICTGIILYTGSSLTQYIFSHIPNFDFKYSEVKYALLTICICWYFQEVLSLAYFQSVAHIIKQKVLTR